MLSFKRYGWLCVLGGEVGVLYLPSRWLPAAALCARNRDPPRFIRDAAGIYLGQSMEHDLGAFYVFALAWIFGAYMVWMHNSSLLKKSESEG